MLSRLADNLYWMSRYMERAENTARMLDVQHQSGMLPGGNAQVIGQWTAVLRRSDLEGAYFQRYSEITSRNVLTFLVADEGNPFSLVSCISAVRENAKAVRVVLAPELWESINATWMEFHTRVDRSDWQRDPSKMFEWIKLHSHLFRGAMIGTMLRDEAYYFSRIGTFVERADNTARLLDVKYVALETTPTPSSGSADYYFWVSVLRSVSAFEIYRKVYRDAITPMRIAGLLIQHPQMPRSLLACMNELVVNIEKVATSTDSEALRQAGKMRADIAYMSLTDYREEQVHLFLHRFLVEINSLASKVSNEFLLPINV